MKLVDKIPYLANLLGYKTNIIVGYGLFVITCIKF